MLLKPRGLIEYLIHPCESGVVINCDSCGPVKAAQILAFEIGHCTSAQCYCHYRVNLREVICCCAEAAVGLLRHMT